MSFSNVTETSLDVSWSDNSDNEDGFLVERRREANGGWGRWVELNDLAANTTTYTDTDVSPSTTYEYRVTGYTEHSTGGASAQVSTADSGIPRQRSGSTGWRVELDHYNGTRTVVPRILDEPRWVPKLNDLPEVRIPVPKSDSWAEPGWKGQPVRVWHNGQRLGIDRLEDVEEETGHMVLVGRGGIELLQHVSAEYISQETHLAAQSLVQNNTSYTANMDDPAATPQADTLMQSADTDAEFTDNLSSIDATEPIAIQNGRLELLQSNYFREGEDEDVTEGSAGYVSNSSYSNGGGTRLTTTDNSTDGGHQGDAVEFHITPEYTIASSNVGLKVLEESTDVPEVEWSINGYLVDYTTDVATSIPYGWSSHGSGAFNGSGYTGPDLEAGTTYTVRIEVVGTSAGDGPLDIDAVALYDKGYSYTWDDTVDANGYLSGPELYPDAYQRAFNKATSAYSITAGEVDATFNDVTGNQAIALSNDDGQTWTSASNTSTLDTTFGSAGGSITFRTTLSRFGSRTTATPTQGFNGQYLDAYDLYADLEDTPVLTNRKFSGRLVDVLNDMAEFGNFLWEYRYDSETETKSVEWTRPGQRTSDVSPEIVDYSVSSSIRDSYERAIINGVAQNVRGEAFTTSLDAYVNLAKSDLLETQEVVYNPSTGTRWERGTDYEMDYSGGQIKALSSGGMSDATQYEIDYEFKTSGSYQSNEYTGAAGETYEDTISGLTTDRACEQAALYFVQRTSEPLWTATVTITDPGPGWSLVDAVDVDQLPDGGNRLKINEITNKPSEVVLELGSRNTAGKVIRDIRQRAVSTSRRV
ncbi:fibronectin type III domain-containing protein [Halobacteriaceae archaeon GCM10025711]